MATPKETREGDSTPRTCSPSSTPRTDALMVPKLDTRVDAIMAFQTVTQHARMLERELEQYKQANASLDKAWSEMLALLRRIARKGEFMDREGLRLTVADWLARRHLSENDTSPATAGDGTKNHG